MATCLRTGTFQCRLSAFVASLVAVTNQLAELRKFSFLFSVKVPGDHRECTNARTPGSWWKQSQEASWCQLAFSFYLLQPPTPYGMGLFSLQVGFSFLEQKVTPFWGQPLILPQGSISILTLNQRGQPSQTGFGREMRDGVKWHSVSTYCIPDIADLYSFQQC